MKYFCWCKDKLRTVPRLRVVGSRGVTVYIYIHCKLPSRAGDTVQEREVWNVLVKILAFVTDLTYLLGAL